MTHDQVMLLRLKGEIETEIAFCDSLAQEYASLPEALSSAHANRLKASIFHDFYTGVERVFRRIAEELNGGVPRSESWHKQLLLDMSLELGDVRPRVVSKDLRLELGNFLRFRHLVRNVYGFELDSDRIMELEAKFVPTMAAFKQHVAVFLEWILSVAQS